MHSNKALQSKHENTELSPLCRGIVTDTENYFSHLYIMKSRETNTTETFVIQMAIQKILKI